MAAVANTATTEKLQKSPYISILADESTDIKNQKKLIIYAQITDPITMEPETLYVSDTKIEDGTGINICLIYVL